MKKVITVALIAVVLAALLTGCNYIKEENGKDELLWGFEKNQVKYMYIGFTETSASSVFALKANSTPLRFYDFYAHRDDGKTNIHVYGVYGADSLSKELAQNAERIGVRFYVSERRRMFSAEGVPAEDAVLLEEKEDYFVKDGATFLPSKKARYYYENVTGGVTAGGETLILVRDEILRENTALYFGCVTVAYLKDGG